MDALFHFIFPLIALLAARVKIKHEVPVMLGLAFSAAFLDIDHFFGMVARGTLHNIFVVLLLPLTLFIVSLKFEKGGTYYKNVALTLLLFWFSHPVSDMFNPGEGVLLFYPFSNTIYNLSGLDLTVPLAGGSTGYIISTGGIGLTIYFLMILGVIFIDDFLEIFKKEGKILKAIKDTIFSEERKIAKFS